MKISKINNQSSVFVLKDRSIKESMKILNSSKYKTLFVIDRIKNKKLIGSITDGDIRRALINGFKLSDKVNKISYKNCFYVFNNKEIHRNTSKIKEYSIEIVPLVNQKKEILELYNIKIEKDNHEAEQVYDYKKNPILIMAGGKGSRLGELTKKTPKSILTLNKISIIDRILNQLIDQSYYNIYISIHYLAEKVKQHLSKYKKKINIKFIEEQKPLGTIGSFKNINVKKNAPAIIIYSDIFTNFDIDKLLNFHKKTKSKITIVGKKHYIHNPYGVLKINKNGKLLSIVEKPTTETLISAGIFILDYNLQKFIKKNKKTETDFLINQALRKNLKISVFNQDDYWYDLGNKKKISQF